jgi:hypothetical protein
MDPVVIPFDADMEAELEHLFARIGPGGYVIRHMVSMIDGKLRAEIRANEHPPPHFHIVYDGEDASYAITTGQRLPNVAGLERYDQIVRFWWGMNRRKLALKWNETRPGNCVVGPVPVPD